MLRSKLGSGVVFLWNWGGLRSFGVLVNLFMVVGRVVVVVEVDFESSEMFAD